MAFKEADLLMEGDVLGAGTTGGGSDSIDDTDDSVSQNGQTPDADDDSSEFDELDAEGSRAEADDPDGNEEDGDETSRADDSSATNQGKQGKDKQKSEKGKRDKGSKKSDDADAGEQIVFRNVEEDKVPEKLRKLKYYAQDEDGTDLIRYKSDEELFQGAMEKERYARQLRKDHETELAEATSKRDQQIAEMKSRLDLYERRMPKEQLREVLVSDKLPDQFRGKTEADIRAEVEKELEDSDILDTDELNQKRADLLADKVAEYRLARRDAEKAVDADFENIGQEEDAQVQEFQQRLADAEPFVSELFTADRMGVAGSEEEAILAEVMSSLQTEKGQGPVTAAQVVTAMLGKDFAELIADGIKQRFLQRRAEKAAEVIPSKRRPMRKSTTSRDAAPARKGKGWADMSGSELMDSSLKEDFGV